MICKICEDTGGPFIKIAGEAGQFCLECFTSVQNGECQKCRMAKKKEES